MMVLTAQSPHIAFEPCAHTLIPRVQTLWPPYSFCDSARAHPDAGIMFTNERAWFSLPCRFSVSHGSLLTRPSSGLTTRSSEAWLTPAASRVKSSLKVLPSANTTRCSLRSSTSLIIRLILPTSSLLPVLTLNMHPDGATTSSTQTQGRRRPVIIPGMGSGANQSSGPLLYLIVRSSPVKIGHTATTPLATPQPRSSGLPSAA